ncbi:MAG: M14 family zinc carboxypeptidase, partial [Longimicrobiales bacterium]
METDLKRTRPPKPADRFSPFFPVGFVILSLTAVGCSGAPPTPAAPAPTPGPALTPTSAFESLYAGARVPGLEDRRFNQETYWGVVGPVVRSSDLFRVEEVGRSGEGRPLRTVSFGNGPTKVFLWSQMHGDESTASMALADIYNLVAREPNRPLVRTILDGVTVHTLPLLNPDGAQRFQRRNAQGIDINRDARALSTPEARTLKAVRDRLSPDVGFNLHDQGIGTRVGRTDRGVAIALLSPPFDESREVNEVRHRAMEVMGVMIRAMDPMVGGHIAKYDDTFNPRAFGDLITQWGTSTILIESGGWADDPQKQYLRKVNFVAILAALESIATGSYQGVGREDYLALPPNGRRIGDLLVTGGTVVIPGLPAFKADFLVSFAHPLLQEGGTIAEIGDLGDAEAMDTLSLDGLFIHPDEDALDRAGGGVQIAPGAPAFFSVSRREDGSEVLW